MSLRSRIRIVAASALAVVAALVVVTATPVDAAWQDAERARVSVTAGTLPPVTMTSCARTALGNVATFTFRTGSGTIAPTGYTAVITSSTTGQVVSTTTGIAPTASTFAVSVGTLALLQRYTVTIRATNGSWSSAVAAQGYVDIVLGLALWSCGTGP